MAGEVWAMWPKNHFIKMWPKSTMLQFQATKIHFPPYEKCVFQKHTTKIKAAQHKEVFHARFFFPFCCLIYQSCHLSFRFASVWPTYWVKEPCQLMKCYYVRCLHMNNKVIRCDKWLDLMGDNIWKAAYFNSEYLNNYELSSYWRVRSS